MMNRGDHQKLSEFSINPFRRRSLWAASDHVLAVEASPFSERYRRYYYADIQALVLTQLGAPLGPLSYALAALAPLASIGLWLNGNRIASLFFIACSLALLIIFALRQECSCHIQTRIGAGQLASLRRLRSARKIVATLQASIDRAQGVLPAEFLPPIFGGAAALPDHIPPRLHAGVSLSLHAVLFALLTLYASAHWFLVDPSAALNAASRIFAFALLGFAIVTAVRQYRTAAPKPIRTLVYLYLAQHALQLLIGVAMMGVAAGIAFARRSPDVETASLQVYPLILLVKQIVTLSDALIGLAGLFLIRRYRAPTPRSIFARGDRPPLG